MNSLTLAVVSCGTLYLGYLLYARLIARLWDFDPDRPTPATERPDGVDYVPARHWTMLFGHHFASIAGVGPVVGPVLACALWGWGPALVWIVVGSVFFGAVHDFSSLMASLRSRGRSIASARRGSGPSPSRRSRSPSVAPHRSDVIAPTAR